MVALRFYATGSMQLDVSSWMRIDQSTVSRTVWRVTNAILNNFPAFTIPADVKTDFYQNFNLPDCTGLIDGTHIRIIRPSQHFHPQEYINRKKFYSINVQVISDSWGTVTNLSAEWPGSVHDSRIFKNTSLYTELLNRTRTGYLVADSGYAISPFCITPYDNATTPAQKNFNVVHKNTRCLIERTIGQAKKRFHCMGLILRIKTERVPFVIAACFLLHNEAKRLYDPPFDYTPGPEDDAGNDPPILDLTSTEAAIRAAGQRKRDELANYMLQNPLAR